MTLSTTAEKFAGLKHFPDHKTNNKLRYIKKLQESNEHIFDTGRIQFRMKKLAFTNTQRPEISDFTLIHDLCELKFLMLKASFLH